GGRRSRNLDRAVRAARGRRTNPRRASPRRTRLARSLPDRGDRPRRAEHELTLASESRGGARLSEKDLPGKGEVAPSCEQVAGEMEIDVVVSGENERLPFRPAGC